MIQQGQTIENPVSGERFTLIRSSQATGGQVTEYEVTVRGRGAVPAAHLHARQEEEFAVLAGALSCRVGDAPARLLGPGERIVIPVGVPHYWHNAGAGELRVRVSFRPALDIEAFFETLCGLANDGKVNAQGAPSLLQVALLSDAYEIYLERPSVATQKILFAILRPIARLLGLRARYPRYGDTGRASTAARDQIDRRVDQYFREATSGRPPQGHAGRGGER